MAQTKSGQNDDEEGKIIHVESEFVIVDEDQDVEIEKEIK